MLIQYIKGLLFLFIIGIQSSMIKDRYFVDDSFKKGDQKKAADYKVFNDHDPFEMPLRQNITRLKIRLKNEKQKNEMYLLKNKRLREAIYLLRHDLNTLEEAAREKVGLIKKDEIFFRIIP
jgi:hypothetical protein